MSAAGGTVPVFVAAGSNVDPQRNLARALALMQARFGALRSSRAYSNAAVGFDGPDFINLVVGFDSEESVARVLAGLHEIEAQCGRARDGPKWAPRTMDLDILLYGDTVAAGPGLSLPRPDLLRRAYMLGPLAEIAPQVVHPQAHRTIAQLWEAFDRDAHPMQVVELEPGKN